MGVDRMGFTQRTMGMYPTNNAVECEISPTSWYLALSENGAYSTTELPFLMGQWMIWYHDGPLDFGVNVHSHPYSIYSNSLNSCWAAGRREIMRKFIEPSCWFIHVSASWHLFVNTYNMNMMKHGWNQRFEHISECMTVALKGRQVFWQAGTWYPPNIFRIRSQNMKEDRV